MESLHYKTILRIVKMTNPILMTGLVAVCWYTAYAGRVAAPYYNRGNWLVIALFFVLYITYGRIYEAFRITLSRIAELIGSQLLALILANAILYVVTWLLTKVLPPAWPLLLTCLAQLFVAGL